MKIYRIQKDSQIKAKTLQEAESVLLACNSDNDFYYYDEAIAKQEFTLFEKAQNQPKQSKYHNIYDGVILTSIEYDNSHEAFTELSNKDFYNLLLLEGHEQEIIDLAIGKEKE